MFDIHVQYAGADEATLVTVYDSLMTDAWVLRDLYSALGTGSARDNQDSMECETCARTVLTLEPTNIGTYRAITYFAPFGVDAEDSGTILCAPCLLKGAHYGNSTIGPVQEEEPAGKHRAA